jgi:hypothetical protein
MNAKFDERTTMSSKFDELTKNLAQSVTRRSALKKFGVGLAGMALACFGLANKAEAGRNPCEKCVKTCLRQNPTWTYNNCALWCGCGL